MKRLLRHAVIASGIELSRHQHDATTLEDIAEESVKFMHRHYVSLNLKLVVRFDLVIAFMIVHFRGITNAVSYAIVYMNFYR